MKNTFNSRCKSPSPGAYQVFRGPADDPADEVGRIGPLVNAWLEARDESRPDARPAREGERKLHDAIKASPLYGKILSFAGMNIWVDARTPDGLVMSQECINL